MYDRKFFRSRVGHAALVSIAAMVTFIGFSSQIAAMAPSLTLASYARAEIA